MSGWGHIWRKPDALVGDRELRAAVEALAARLAIAIVVDDRVASPRHLQEAGRTCVVFELARADLARVVALLDEDPELADDDLAGSPAGRWRVAVEVYPDVDGTSTLLAFESPLLDNQVLSGTGMVLADALAAAVGAQMSGIY